MICEKCKEEGLTSKVYTESMAHYCMAWEPYYDEQGVFHSHDVNHNGSLYRCSRGHVFHVNNIPTCPAKNCDWNKDKFSLEQEFLESKKPSHPIVVDWNPRIESRTMGKSISEPIRPIEFPFEMKDK